ncbi:TonB-dependent receptor domain-containing protein [Aliidiomarina quisquiliarum]|uniref:TonB-dependent receptor domain-containing protein n=1 Tax=Aliidiomarina quisquiliarum TaxID=2938947 RepID=UPI00208ED788|nr:TonB-dependent receptor [Aliidiomarina quisquiliarum]MCO4320313.1 TonB-dependent receptor [Aliidiomarina quisquiliarum]
MIKQSLVSKSIKTVLMAGVGSVFLVGAPVMAQAQNDTDNNEETAEKFERIITTGSRISRPELSQAAPIVTLNQEDIERFGSPDLGQILAELPAVGASNTLIGNRTSNSSAGVSSANLRNLGASRTLILIDGKRHVAGSPGSASVDLSTIPSSMIERVEIMTGGASAIYGSDAVSGVVNVILKKNFEGLEFNARGASSVEGVGARNHEFNILGGGDFAEGRGNAVFYAGLSRTQQTMENDIRQSNNWGTILNPADTGRLDGIPDRIWAENVGSEYISGNGVLHGDDLYGFRPDGSWVVQPDRDGTNSALFGSFNAGCDTCAFNEDYDNYQPEISRVNVGSRLNFEMNRSTNFYADFKYTNADITQQFQPAFATDIRINVVDNPYLNEDLRAHLLSEGLEQVTMYKFFEDWGNRTAENRRELFRVSTGIEGDFELGSAFFLYDIYYGYGETRNKRVTKNEKINGNVLAAVDTIRNASGDIVCRDKNAGGVNMGGECVAYNPFGQNASAAAVAFMTADVTREDKITQEYVGATFVTDTGDFIELQGGPIDVAFGFEWREETSGTITDEFTRRGLTNNAATPNEFGKFDVSEGFVEVNLPLLRGVKMVDELSIDLAYRGADYSHAGSANAWKVGFVYAPIEDVRFRGTMGVAVRAPNVAEAFSPRSPGFVNINDPCDVTNITKDPSRAANCAALGIPVGFDAVTNVSIDLISGGNPNLSSEESDSKTFGVVWMPSFIKNFSLTLDYYDIEITDAITFIDPQTVINNCVDSESGIGNNYCGQVTRDPDTKQLTAVESGYLNAAALKTSGYEMEAKYYTDLSGFDLPGSIATSLFVSHLDTLVSYNFQDKPDQDNVNRGQIGTPKWQARFSTTYRLDGFNVSWTARYLDRSALFDVTPRLESYENISPNYVGSIVTHDLSAGYMVTDNLRISGGIRNLFDKLAPGYVNNPLYDLVGRRAYGSLTYTF